MTDEEAITFLRAVRYSSKFERYGHQLPSISAIARKARLTRTAIYQILHSGHMSYRSRSGIKRAVEALRRVDEGQNGRSFLRPTASERPNSARK